jgi:hypothetical protein
VEQDDGRPQVVDAPARWLNDEISGLGNLQGTPAGARGRIQDYELIVWRAREGLRNGRETAHIERWRNSVVIARSLPLHDSVLLWVEIADANLEARMSDDSCKGASEGAFSRSPLLRYEADHDCHCYPLVPASTAAASHWQSM